MLSYAIKRVVRSMGLFAALLLGVILASTFFAGVNVGADTSAKAALTQQLNSVPVDIIVGFIGSQSPSATTLANVVSNVASISGVTDAEIISGTYSYENATSFRIVGVSNASRVYDGLTVISGVSLLGENETLVWADSTSANQMELNSTLTLNITYWVYPQDERALTVSLRVVGFVDLDEKAYAIASGNLYGPVLYQSAQQQRAVFGDNLLIVSWEKTIRKLLDAVSSEPASSGPFSTEILVYVDRDALINPWDIPNSVAAVTKVTNQVNQVAANYGMGANDNLGYVLARYEFNSMQMRFSFLLVALPVFFVAWYVGTTVSDVSYNLRRREIGLLLTKGFSNGQLFRMFLTESVMIGIIGGLIGVGLGFILSPLFATVTGGELGASPVLSKEIAVLAVVFSLAITLLSTFRPSRRASQLPPIDALREYVYTEEVKPYKQRWPWIAFSLGTYKIVMFLFGVDLFAIFAGKPLPSQNIIIMLILGTWMLFDHFILTYIGPLLFFWGFTKIFIGGSLKFQELVTRAAKFLGDLGTLATKNVQRNPVRTASVAFLIALIIGYSFQTVGAVASEQDYVIRQVKADVGADISVDLASTANVSEITSAIEQLSGVVSTTPEYSLSGTFSYYSIQVRAIDPGTWLSAAYYENEWFSGNDAATAFQQMKTNNQTIILERNTAKSLDEKVGDNMTLTIGSTTLLLQVVGFFGPEVLQQSGGRSVFWSYVPLGLYDSLGLSWLPSVRILVKLLPSTDGKSVASDILNLENVSYVRSLAQELETYQSDLTRTGSLNIQRLGVIFSILAASIATGLATLVSLQERKRETSIMNARGLSFKQLITMLLSENLAIVFFSAVLGVVVGLIGVRGNVAAFNISLSTSLVIHRMVFPPDAIILLSTSVILVFASAIIPVILLTKIYTSKIERIVRV